MDSLKSAASGVTNTVSSGAQSAGNAATSGAQSAGNAASSGAQSATNAASSAGNSASNAASSATGSGTQNWDAMSEEQKKQTFDKLPEDQKQMGYYEWLKQGYQHKMENWMPWIEDVYLKWFTNDNKASYATKDTLDKSKVTGIEQVDTLQDGVNNLVGQQVGKGGLLQPVGDMASKEGINRAERGGKDDGGNYLGSSLVGGAKSAGGYVGGLFGGGGKK